jgi:site-specific recombinase
MSAESVVPIHEQVVTFLERGIGSDHDAYELAAWFQALANAPTLAHRLDALIGLVQWMDGHAADGELARSRVLKILEVLESLPAARSGVQDTFADVLAEMEGTNPFGETGIPGDRGFLGELFDRIMGRVLPAPRDDNDLARLIARLSVSHSRTRSLESMAPEFFHRLMQAVAPADRPEIWSPLKRAFADGFRLLAVTVQSQGLSAKLRARSHAGPLGNSPFYQLAEISDGMMDAWREGQNVSALSQQWRQACAGCRAEIAEISSRLETAGVSVDIVYGLEVLERCLKRMQAMLFVIEAPQGQSRSEAIHQLLAALIVSAQEDGSIRHLVSAKLQILSRNMVERQGNSVEHYVAQTRRQYGFIWPAAVGGGLLMVLTVAIQLKITHTGLPLFLQGVLTALNYAVSFLLLHHFRLMLAIRQPAMTAATLARLMRTRDRTERLDGVVEFTVRVFRSQLAAAVANVAVVFTGVFVFNFFWKLAVGHSYLGEKEAQYVFAGLGPLNGGTVFYGALTGVMLWMAAMFGGWMDNWAVYHRLPRAINEHRLAERFGRERMQRAADVVSRNMSGWATSISLGFLFAFAPFFGKFVGLPLEVRHVTLSYGMLAFADAGSRGWFSVSWFLWTLVGVATVFLLNLGVSFFLALYTAMRACKLERKELALIGAGLLRRLLKRPLDFVLPRGAEPTLKG